MSAKKQPKNTTPESELVEVETNEVGFGPDDSVVEVSADEEAVPAPWTPDGYKEEE